MKPNSTYSRKYYLVRKIKAEGFELHKSSKQRIILVPANRAKDAQLSGAVTELVNEHHYGLQYTTNPAPQCENAKSEALRIMKSAFKTYMSELFKPIFKNIPNTRKRMKASKH